MKLRKWVTVMITIVGLILIGRIIYNMATIRTIKDGKVCNGKFIKICSSNYNYDL